MLPEKPSSHALGHHGTAANGREMWRRSARHEGLWSFQTFGGWLQQSQQLTLGCFAVTFIVALPQVEQGH